MPTNGELKATIQILVQNNVRIQRRLHQMNTPNDVHSNKREEWKSIISLAVSC